MKSALYYNYYCTNNLSCPIDFPSLIKERRECINNNNYKSTDILIQIYSTLIKETIDNSDDAFPISNLKEPKLEDNNDIKTKIQNLLNLKNNTTFEMNEDEEIKFYDMIIKNIESIFMSPDYDTTKLDNGKDEVIETERMTITLTTAQNQKNNNNNNMTTLYLGECENSLRKYYNLSNDEILYIRKIDIQQKDMKIPKIEYDVYSKLSGLNLSKLNISVCEKNKILLSVPINITENIDKLNSSSGYFNDICYTATSEGGTDILLKDRKKDYIQNNKAVCQEDCDFTDYNFDTFKANCSCQVKKSSSSKIDMNINKTKLYENFGDLNSNKKDASNLGITSCNVFSSKENIESNTGFFLLIIILAIFIIIFIIFCSRGYNSLENKIDEIIYKKFKNEEKSQNNKIENLFKKGKDIPKIKPKKIKTLKNLKTNSLKLKTSGTKILNNKPKKGLNTKNILSKFKSKINNNKKSSNSNFKPDTDYEINWLSYEDALKYDKRINCEYYCSLIKSKQLFIFTFCSFNDYNSGIVKKFMLFLSFALHYTSNALFFTESTLHQIYEDEGKFNFEYQISNILYSAIISTFILRLMLQVLVLTDKDVLEVKNQQTKNMAVNMKRKKLKYMKIKFAIFFILNFILLVLFWYYLTCFNAIYKNSQIYLIKNTVISFSFSLFYPFVINIFPTLFRMCSIHSKNKNHGYLYKLSQIIQMI